MLALLPLDPGAGVGRGREPAVDGAPERRLAPQAGGERELVDRDAEPLAQLAQRAELVQLGEAVERGSRRGVRRGTTSPCCSR